MVGTLAPPLATEAPLAAQAPAGGFIHDDGGRAAAGYRGAAGDCVTRAIAIALQLPYEEVYSALFVESKIHEPGAHASPRHGVSRAIYQRYLEDQGWIWVPTMRVGVGCEMHLRADELPAGRIIVRLSRHVAAVIDGVLYDTHDCRRDGTRCVYGYFHKPVASGV